MAVDVPEHAVDDAEALAAAGRPLDAIDALTAANRQTPRAEIEARLVTLRHEGFWNRAVAPEAPAPPPDMSAIEPPSVPLPELRPPDLTAGVVREHIRRDGCVLVRGLVPLARTAELAQGIDRALDAFDASLDGATVADTAPWFVPFTPKPGTYRAVRRKWVRASGGIWTADSPRMLFELLDTVEQTGIGALITEYLGERPVMAANKCTLRRVPLTDNGDWHQDGAFLGREVRSLNLWLSLSHCGTDAPGLDIVPRRMDALAPTGTEGANFEWAVSPQVVTELAETSPVVRPEFAPGDALLFDHMFLHRTAIDPTMTRERYAIESWFFAGSAYPADQVPLLY